MHPDGLGRRGRRRSRQRKRMLLAAALASAMVLLAVGVSFAVASRDDPAARRASGESPARDSTSPPRQPATKPPASPATTAAPEPATTAPPTTRGARGSGQPVTLAFGGDTHFEAHLRTKLANDPGGGFLAPIAPVLGAADVSIVNLETAITEGGSPVAKQYVFRTPPTALDALRGAGVDAVTVANNHGLDYGASGLQDTLAARASGVLPVLGVGANAGEAYAPWKLEVKGQRLAVFAATDVLDDAFIESWTATDAQPGLASVKGDGLRRLADAVAAERAHSDTIVVYLHWGVEKEVCPSARQQEVATALTAAGADVVVGSHAHRVQGAGRAGGAFVAYGLGNFVWYNEAGASGDTGVLTVTVTGREIDGYEWRPARIRDGVPVPLEGDAQAARVAEWEQQRACTGLAR